MRQLLPVALLLALALALAPSRTARAQATGPAPAPAPAGPEPGSKDTADAKPEVARTSGPEVVVAAGKGLTVTSADKRFQITFRSRAQLRETYAHADAGSTNEVSVRTLRFYTYGYVLVPELKYYVQLAFGAGDFEKDNPSPIFDAFVEYVGVRDFNVRFGQYFVPFDRARTIREFALQFVDRQAVVRELSLDRDIGLMLSSTDVFGWGSRLAYNIFLGSGDGKNRVNDVVTQKPSVLAVGRLVLRPFGAFDDDQEGDLTRSPKPKLAFGVAAAFNKATSRDHSTYGNVYAHGTFDYTHAASDLVFKWHGFAFLAEGLVRQANQKSKSYKNADGTTTVEHSRSGFGYFAQAGQMLTDKVELTARWEDLHNRKGTDPAFRKLVQLSGRQVGGGLNVYLNGHFFKLQTDYFYAFNQGVGKPTHTARVQLDATF